VVVVVKVVVELVLAVVAVVLVELVLVLVVVVLSEIIDVVVAVELTVELAGLLLMLAPVEIVVAASKGFV
jgi:hypothetical protein